jgi:hypothetical protein
MDQTSAPKIKRTHDVGETPFQFISKIESILQGWDQINKKMVFLFKADTGNWGYWDKDTEQVVEISEWEGKAAFIRGVKIKMAVYHRLHLLFTQPVIYGEYDSVSRKEIKMQTSEAIVTVTDQAHKLLLEQMSGRSQNDIYRFGWTSRKLGRRVIKFIDKVTWVNLATIQ